MGPKSINSTKFIFIPPFITKLYFVHDFIPNLKFHMSSTKVVGHMDIQKYGNKKWETLVNSTSFKLLKVTFARSESILLLFLGFWTIVEKNSTHH